MNIMTYGALSESGTEFWLPSGEINALFHMDLNNGNNASFVGTFHDCIKDNAGIIQKVISWEDNLYFFSRYSYEMWVMEKDRDNIQHCAFFNGSAGVIDDVVVWQDKAYIISRWPLTILVMDLTNSTTARLKWENEMELEDNVCSMAVQKDETIFLVTREQNSAYLGIINCESQDICFNRMDQLSFAKCVGVAGNCVFVLGLSKDNSPILLKYDLFGKHFLEGLQLEKIEVNRDSRMEYLKCIEYGNKLFFIPGTVGRFMVFDIESNSETEINFPEIAPNKIYLPFYEVQQIQNLLYLFPGSFGKILKLDLETFQTTVINVDVQKGDYDKAFVEVIEQGGSIVESLNINLNNLLSLSQIEQDTLLQGQSCGEKIYSKLLKDK